MTNFSFSVSPRWRIINNGIDTYLIIVNDTYNLKNKSYEKGQCVKVINHFIVGNSSQEDVDDILTTTKINRIIIKKGFNIKEK